MRLFNVIFIILFTISAVLQYNDPDSYVWVPIYVYGALLCYSALRSKYNPSLYIFGLLAYSGYAFYLFFTKDGVLSWIKEHKTESTFQSMEAAKPWIEDTREFFGLLILVSVLSINMVWLSKKPKK